MLVQMHSSLSASNFQATFIILIYSFTFTCQEACNPEDERSLLTFHDSVTSSLGPLNWSTTSDCCSSWEGISCDDGGRVTRLWLPSRALRGSISLSLGRLTTLSQINLSHNYLSGVLPYSLFTSIHALKIIDLSYNQLYGHITASIFSNSTLSPGIEVIDISSNRLQGEIDPTWFGSRSNLTAFNASNNGFTSQIPSAICIRCPLIKNLDFSFNNFSGQIPKGLGRCAKLEVLRAGFNFLSGLLPQDIYSLKWLVELSVPTNSISGFMEQGLLELTNLRILELYANDISGIIPRDIYKLSNLEQLLLHTNQLIGSIPPSLMNCSNLTKLILRFNSLQGNISELDFSKLSRLRVLDLGNNNFTGNLPESLYTCKSLTALRVSTNRLTGQISPKIKALPSLSFLSVSNNSFTNITEALTILADCKSLTVLLMTMNYFNEKLPGKESLPEPDRFQNLQVLALGISNLTGQLPVWLLNIKKLQVLDLGYNRLNGKIPDWFGSLPSIFYLVLSHNFLTGDIPPQLGRLPALVSESVAETLNQSYLELPMLAFPTKVRSFEYNQISHLPRAIYIKGNNLTGNIPAELSQLQNLHLLDLSDNFLSGSIPPQLSKLKNLEVLDLSNNKFSGKIPWSLKTLNFLSKFNVSLNHLEGPVPTGGQFDTYSVSSYLGNSRLCGLVLQRPCNDQSIIGADHKETTRGNEKFFLSGFVLGFSILFPTVVAIMVYFHYRDLNKYCLR